MQVLAVQSPANQPIGPKTNVLVCPHCGAVLSYGYEDMWVKHLGENNELNYVTCMVCNKDIRVTSLKNLHQ